MPPAAWRPPGRPRWGWQGCGCGSPRGCAPSAPLLAFLLPRPTSPNGGAPATRGQRWAGAWGGQGSELEVLGRRWRGLGLVDAYWRRGEPEARWVSWGEEDVDMGRRWRAWQRPGERERGWRGLGVEDAHGRRGERDSWRTSRGEGDVDMGRRWLAWRRPGERERRERGPGGFWWPFREPERRE